MGRDTEGFRGMYMKKKSGVELQCTGAGRLARWRAHRLPVPVTRPMEGNEEELMWVVEKFQRNPLRAWSL